MKPISISLETLKSGNIRVTGRHHGATVSCKEGATNQARALVSQVMQETCGEHRFGVNNYDLTYIDINEAAKQCLSAT